MDDEIRWKLSEPKTDVLEVAQGFLGTGFEDFWCGRRLQGVRIDEWSASWQWSDDPLKRISMPTHKFIPLLTNDFIVPAI